MKQNQSLLGLVVTWKMLKTVIFYSVNYHSPNIQLHKIVMQSYNRSSDYFGQVVLGNKIDY